MTTINMHQLGEADGAGFTLPIREHPAIMHVRISVFSPLVAETHNFELELCEDDDVKEAAYTLRLFWDEAGGQVRLYPKAPRKRLKLKKDVDPSLEQSPEKDSDDGTEANAA